MIKNAGFIVVIIFIIIICSSWGLLQAVGNQDVFSRNAEKSRGFPIFPTSREYNTGGWGRGLWALAHWNVGAPPLCGNAVGKVVVVVVAGGPPVQPVCWLDGTSLKQWR